MEGLSDAISAGHSVIMRRDHALGPGKQEQPWKGSWKQVAEINNQADKSPRWGSPFISILWGLPSPAGREVYAG
jgi:hypothetical protein